MIIKTEKKLYKGSFNYQGETITIWTHAYSENQAFCSFIEQLTLQLNKTRISICNYFLSGKDNYLIEQKQKED